MALEVFKSYWLQTILRDHRTWDSPFELPAVQLWKTHC